MFFFNDTATTEIYTLSLHDALPISHSPNASRRPRVAAGAWSRVRGASPVGALVRTSSDVLMVAPYAGITRSGSSGRRRVESPSQPGPPELPHMALFTIGPPIGARCGPCRPAAYGHRRAGRRPPVPPPRPLAGSDPPPVPR